jgi:hypothetical protein
VSLNKDMEGAQESLRLSANQMVKLNKELNEYRTQIGKNNDENESYKMKIKNLLV